jgi:hypothetical protein
MLVAVLSVSLARASREVKGSCWVRVVVGVSSVVRYALDGVGVWGEVA